MLDLFRTAMEISEISYTPDSKRTPKQILRFHNLTYQHGKLCIDMFTQSSGKNPVFSSYFHSLTCHSPLLLRLISLRSVNTEVQERIFRQAKQITRSTSCLRPDHVITNILARIHAESKTDSNTLKIQESEIHKLAYVLESTPNTLIPQSWIDTNPYLYQAHLERISDFLVPGPGVWWQHTAAGIEFFDSYLSPTEHLEGPHLHHVRSASLADIDIYLHKKWEECCYKGIQLPANHVYQYQSDGSPSSVTNIQAPCTCTSENDIQNQHQHSIHHEPTGAVQFNPQLPDTAHNITPTSASHSAPQPVSTEHSTYQPKSSGTEYVTSFTPQSTGVPHSAPQPVSTEHSTYQPTSSGTEYVNPQPITQATFRTTLAKALSQVIDADSTLMEFDVLRNRAKKAKQMKSCEHKHIQYLSSKLKNCLISKYKEIHATMKNWANEDKENVTLRDQPRHIMQAFHKLNVIEKILKHEWELDTACL